MNAEHKITEEAVTLSNTGNNKSQPLECSVLSSALVNLTGAWWVDLRCTFKGERPLIGRRPRLRAEAALTEREASPSGRRRFDGIVTLDRLEPIQELSSVCLKASNQLLACRLRQGFVGRSP